MLSICEVIFCGLLDSRPHILAMKFDYNSMDTLDLKKERNVVEDRIFYCGLGDDDPKQYLETLQNSTMVENVMKEAQS